MCVHLIDAINGTANFTVEKTWGYKNPKTGEFNGMTGQLIRKEADIGGTIIYMVPSRLQQMEFVSMIVDTRAEFVFRAPPLSYVANIYYYPFVTAVWIASTILLLTCAIVVYFAFIHSDTELQGQYEVKSFTSEVLLLAAGIMSQMGIHFSPRSSSGQIAMVKIDMNHF